jgi:hypothetical protein
MASIPNEHYYIDKNGLMVFTEEYHLERGYCCQNGCRHCPYGNGPVIENNTDDSTGKQAAE